MPKVYDKCVSDVRKKISTGKMPKTYKCDANGKSNKRGKKRCRSNPYAICGHLRK